MHLIFDRYRYYSIKGQIKLERLDQYARAHTLTMDTSLLTRETTLKATRTKVQMINLITKAFLDHFKSIKCHKKLIVTNQGSIPIQAEHVI